MVELAKNMNKKNLPADNNREIKRRREYQFESYRNC